MNSVAIVTSIGCSYLIPGDFSQQLRQHNTAYPRANPPQTLFPLPPSFWSPTNLANSSIELHASVIQATGPDYSAAVLYIVHYPHFSTLILKIIIKVIFWIMQHFYVLEIPSTLTPPSLQTSKDNPGFLILHLIVKLSNGQKTSVNKVE